MPRSLTGDGWGLPLLSRPAPHLRAAFELIPNDRVTCLRLPAFCEWRGLSVDRFQPTRRPSRKAPGNPGPRDRHIGIAIASYDHRVVGLNERHRALVGTVIDRVGTRGSREHGAGCNHTGGERDGGAEFRAAIAFRLRGLAKIAQGNMNRAV